MKGGTLLYKCRRCGAEHGCVHVPDLLGALIDIQVTGATRKDWGAFRCHRTDVHSCRDGHLGVADLIGGRKDER